MKVETVLLPENSAELPAEARDHGVLWAHLQKASVSAESAMASTREVERVVENDRIRLRVEGSLADHSASTLDGLVTAITNNVSGLKQHPDGWVEVEEVTV